MKSARAGAVRAPAAEGSAGPRAVPDGVQLPHVPLLIGGHGHGDPDPRRGRGEHRRLVATREQRGISYVVVHDTAVEAMRPIVATPAGT